MTRLLLPVLLLAACTSERPPPDAPATDGDSLGDLLPAPSGVQAPVAETDADDLAPPLVGRLAAAAEGDRACYLTLVDDAGTEAVVMAAFEVCETDLIGGRVRLTYAPTNVMAEGCQGDPVCPDTETVLLAVSVEPEG